LNDIAPDSDVVRIVGTATLPARACLARTGEPALETADKRTTPVGAYSTCRIAFLVGAVSVTGLAEAHFVLRHAYVPRYTVSPQCNDWQSWSVLQVLPSGRLLGQ